MTAYKGDKVRLVKIPERMECWYKDLKPDHVGLVLSDPTALGLVRVQFDDVTIYLGSEHYQVLDGLTLAVG